VISTPVAVAAPSTDDRDMMYKAAIMSAFQDLQDRAKPLPPSDSLFEMVTKTLIAGENADTLHLANSINLFIRKGFYFSFISPEFLVPPHFYTVFGSLKWLNYHIPEYTFVALELLHRKAASLAGLPSVSGEMTHIVTGKVCLYAASSSVLLVLNKISITAIPNATLLLFVQLLSTALFILGPGLLGAIQINIFPPSSTVKAYFYEAAVFLTTIYSNFQVINAIGVNSFIVLRCGTPLVICYLDWIFMGRQFPRGTSLLPLFGIFACGSTYSFLKFSEQPSPKALIQSSPTHVAVFWSLVWFSSFILDMVYIKYIVHAYPCSGFERTLYQNVLALPMLLLSGIFEPHGTISLILSADATGITAVILSCIAGTALSYTGMSLRSDLSATSFTVLGIVCKMASSILNEIFVAAEGNKFSLLCLAGVIMCSAFYRQAPERENQTSLLQKSGVFQRFWEKFKVRQREIALGTGILLIFMLLFYTLNDKVDESYHGNLAGTYDVPKSPARLVETAVIHKAGLFSQLFIMLDAFMQDIEVHGNSSSLNWHIEAYSPAQGSSWNDGKFEDIFLPVRHIRSSSQSFPELKNYYKKVRREANFIFRLRPEVESALNYYAENLNLHEETTLCAHVRRGNKQSEGIRMIDNAADFVSLINFDEPDFQKVYVLSDDELFIQALSEALTSMNASVIPFPEKQCVVDMNLTEAQCFCISVFLMTRGVCKQFFGSSTSNVGRMIMLLGETFIDMDGVLDYFTASIYGRWYEPHDHCYVVDNILSSGELCGYLSPRCVYCIQNKCPPIPSCV